MGHAAGFASGLSTLLVSAALGLAALASPLQAAPRLAGAWVAPPAAPATLPAPADDDFLQVYLSKAEALAHVFPGAAQVLELRHLLTARETAAIEAQLGARLAEGGFYIYAAWDGARDGGRDAERATVRASSQGPPARDPDAYAVVVMEIGKTRPITHIVEVQPGGAAGDRATAGRVAVMVYRETHGSDVASERFMAQYVGMSLADPIRIDRDVINIAGSTLSAHAICRGVRKALATVQAVLLDKDASARAALVARGADVTPTSDDAPAPANAASDRDDETARADAGPGRDDETARTDAGPGRDDESARADAGPGRDDETAAVVRERRVMGTLARVSLPFDPDRGGSLAWRAAAAEAALDELARWDGVLSDWRSDTPLSRLNAAPPGQGFALDAGLARFLRHADALVAATGGAFDPSVGALVDAWGLRTPTPSRPGGDALRDARQQAGWRHLSLASDGRSATRARPGLRLDPGASGKGFALDRAAEVLRAHGVRSALLSFRSTLLALGAPQGEPGFAIPIRHDGDGRDVGRVLLVDGALSVSGGLPAGFDDGPVQRGHVLDPRSGEPVPAARLAWVVAGSAADADALSTALLVAGPGLPGFRDAGGRPARGGYVAGSGAASVAWPLAHAERAVGDRSP